MLLFRTEGKDGRNVCGRGPELIGGGLRNCKSPKTRIVPFMIALLAVWGLSACRTSHPLPPLDLLEPGWRVRQGQAVWFPRQHGPEIAGELLVATHPNGRTFLQFTKTPLPFVVAQTGTNDWQIAFVTDHRTFSGRGRPPKRLAWFQLGRCLAGGAPSAEWKWNYSDDGHWRLENRLNGQWLEGFVSP